MSGVPGVPSYTLTLTATEIGDLGSDTVDITINVADINDEAPTCTFNTFTENIPDKTNGPYTIKDLACFDTDDTATTFTYISSSTKFVVDSGIVKLDVS